MTILVAVIAVAALSLALALGVAQRRDRRRIAELEADYAAVPTEVRAMRAGERAAELEERRKAHHLRNLVQNHEERIDRLRDQLSALRPGDTPSDTLTGDRNGR
jgi:hypothetical protein